MVAYCGCLWYTKGVPIWVLGKVTASLARPAHPAYNQLESAKLEILLKVIKAAEDNLGR